MDEEFSPSFVAFWHFGVSLFLFAIKVTYQFMIAPNLKPAFIIDSNK